MGQFDKRAVFLGSEVPATHREEDFCGWLANQASLLRSENYAALDSADLAEELEEMAASERRKVIGLLCVVLVHLLKWHYSKIRGSENSWKVSLATSRIDAIDVLEDYGTLRNELPSLLAKAYRGSCSVAGTEMRLAKRDWQRMFRDICPWNESQVLEDDFFPEIAPGAYGRS